MKLVFQCRLTTVEVDNLSKQDKTAFALETMMTMTAEMIYMKGGKQVACQIVNDDTGEVVKDFE